MTESIPVAILGATGSVGQRFVQLLNNHPWFRVVALAGSDRTVGQAYGEACRWLLPEPMPVWAREMVLAPVIPPVIPRGMQARIVFSALPAALALQVEPEFARAGMAVCSNASAFRRHQDVPLLLPEVNPEHAGLVPIQRKQRNWPGCIVTNPNCTSTGLTVALKALQDVFRLQRAFVVSLQALSGAGYPGVASLDVADNVLPYIEGEEDKVEWEPRKMLGRLGTTGRLSTDGGLGRLGTADAASTASEIELADLVISAHTNRVAVSDGHTVCVSLELAGALGCTQSLDMPADELCSLAARTLADYQAPATSRDLPSAPRPVIRVREENDRPQPRLDRMEGRGMTTVIGRLRPDPLFHLKFVVLSHNTIRGAAGGSIYNAELLVKEGLA